MTEQCVVFFSFLISCLFSNSLSSLKSIHFSSYYCHVVLSLYSLIQGFMQKLEAEKMLLSCAPGTFLIRFSEGDPGGVSIAWVREDDMVTGKRSVLSLAPWNKHDLGMRSLADR